MKKTSIFIVVCLVIFVTGNAFCSLVISKLLGKSGVYQETTKEWATPAVGLALDKGDKLKTFENGKVELTFDDGTTLWVRENTEIDITLLLPEDRVISLNKGQIRSKVTPLKVGQAFTVKTKTAVAAIRGTEFIMVMGDAGSKLLVVSGKIEYTNPISNVSYPVVEGQSSLCSESGEMSAPAVFTAEDTAIVQDTGWNEINSTPPEPVPAEEPQKEETKKELNKLRQEIKDMVSDIKTNVQVAREIVQEIRDADVSSGRTLRDVHGNLVRVEQYLMRPTPSTVQLLNITKRDNYVYRGYFTGAVPNSGKRVDSFEATIKFNMAFPDKLSDWPSFVKTHGDGNGLEPETMVMKMSNGKDSIINTFTRSETIKTNPDGTTDKDDEWNGTVKYISGTQGEWLVDTEEYVNSYEVPDGETWVYHGPEGQEWQFPRESYPEMYYPQTVWKTVTEYLPGWFDTGKAFDKYNGEEPTSLEGWAVSPLLRLYKEKGTDNKYTPGVDTEVKYVNMGTEFAVIGNDGGIFSKDKMLGLKGGNPFTFLKEIAIEESMVCKENTAKQPTSLDDFNKLNNFFVKNIDLVITPDIMMSIAMKLGPSFENMSSKSILRRKDTI